MKAPAIKGHVSDFGCNENFLSVKVSQPPSISQNNTRRKNTATGWFHQGLRNHSRARNPKPWMLFNM